MPDLALRLGPLRLTSLFAGVPLTSTSPKQILFGSSQTPSPALQAPAWEGHTRAFGRCAQFTGGNAEGLERNRLWKEKLRA